MKSLAPALAVLALASTTTTSVLAEDDPATVEALDGPRPTLTGRPVIRDAFHFQVAFGLGGGPDSLGLFHAMEIGGTFPNGMTLALLHTFIQNKGILSERGGPDLYGAWIPEFKVPLGYDDLIGKLALGPAGIHIQEDGIEVKGGIGWVYGLDFHLPFFRRSGLTLGAQMLHVHEHGKHHAGFSSSLGYTFF
jgi:hypothetical protein